MNVLTAAVLLLCMWPGGARSQTQSTPASETPSAPATVPTAAPATAPTAAPEEEHGDRYAALWEQSEQLRLVYEKTRDDKIAEVDRLLRTKRCQIYRVSGLIDRTLAAMREYLEAARKYYELWDLAEEKRVEMLRKSLAQMEADKARLEMTLDEEKKDHEKLEQQENYLEQSTRTEEIRKQMDDLKESIRDSEDKLTLAQQQFDSITIRINTTNAVLTERLVSIRQSLSKLEVFSQSQTAVYEDKRKAAHEVCDANQPRTPPTKRPVNP